MGKQRQKNLLNAIVKIFRGQLRKETSENGRDPHSVQAPTGTPLEPLTNIPKLEESAKRWTESQRQTPKERSADPKTRPPSEQRGINIPKECN